MNLDINTPKGQISLMQEQTALNALRAKFNRTIVQTPKKLDAKCDGMILSADNSTINSVYEIKCRENLEVGDDGLVYYVSPNGRRYVEDTWLITNEKITSCVDVASKLRVPFIGLLYIVPSNIVFQFHISNAMGNYMFPFDVKNTRTQKTTNGGQIMRDNAYLPFKYARIVLDKNDFQII